MFIHPYFFSSQSMPRFARMVGAGMRSRGHRVDEWTAIPLVYKLSIPARLKKWLGYIDQYILFPLLVHWRLRRVPADTLFIFSDQALGPWVPLVANRAHVLHINDLLAVRSALGEFPQNPVSWSGRQYQAMIRRGLARGRTFISISKNTREDLHRFLPGKPACSKVVYLGLNFPFRALSEAECKATLSSLGLTPPPAGFLLHVGGNQWYKNRAGVLEIYHAYAERTESPLPLWMVGDAPTLLLKGMAARIVGKGEVRFLTGLSNEEVCAAYSSARLLLFPSVAEGFGWPIAEAMACGCLVLTTGEAPMTEVGGDAAFYISRRPNGVGTEWCTQGARCVREILGMSSAEVLHRQQLGFRQIAQFETERTLDAYERIYQEALARRARSETA